MNNKRGVIPFVLFLAFIIIGSVLAISSVLGLIFSDTFRWWVVGGSLIFMSVTFAMRSNNQKLKTFIIVGGLIIGFVFISFAGVLNSILGVSTYEDLQGDTHWLINGVADNVDEGFIFSSLPNKITKADGTTVEPKETAKLTVSKKESYCSYQLNKVEKSKFFGALKMNYYELLSSERIALISIKDDSGQEKIIDGTTQQVVTFFDNDGELEFKSIGIIGSKKDCESGNNVAILFVGGNTLVKDRADLENTFSNLGLLSGITGIQKARDNQNFLSNFNDYTADTNRFKGDVNVGNIQFTIDADQKYYNSFVFEPAKEIKPSVGINLAREVKGDGTTSAVVTITNKEDSSGSINVISSVDRGSVIPSQQNVILEDKVILNYIIKAPTSDGNVDFTVEACSTSSPINCDEATASFNVLKEAEAEKITDFCGDGTCQSNEGFTSCPSDCKKEESKTGDEEKEGCKWYQEEFTETKLDRGFLWWKSYTPFIEPEEIKTTGCKVSGIVNVGAIVLVVIVLGSIAILSMRKPKRRKRK